MELQRERKGGKREGKARKKPREREIRGRGREEMRGRRVEKSFEIFACQSTAVHNPLSIRVPISSQAFMAGTKAIAPDVLGEDPSAVHSSSEQQEVEGDQEARDCLPKSALVLCLILPTTHPSPSSVSTFPFRSLPFFPPLPAPGRSAPTG